MLHILIRTVIATIVICLPYISWAGQSLAEIAAGLSIDETLEMEHQDIQPEENVRKLELPKKPNPPLIQSRKRIPSSAAPAQRLPLYMYRSFDNNFSDIPPKKPEVDANNSEGQPPSSAIHPQEPTQPSPAEQAVTKEYNEIKTLEPATGAVNTAAPIAADTAKTSPPPTVPPAPPTPEPSATGNATPTKPAVDKKEQAMRRTIEEVEKKRGNTDKTKGDALSTAVKPKTDAPYVTRIGSVPSMQKEADYVSILEQSLLLDPQPLPLKRAFYDENGKEVTLKQFKGKLVLLNFWATWCTPCAMEMPSLDALQESFDDRELPVKVIALSQDFKGVDFIRAFYKQNNIIHLDIYHDKGNAFFRDLGIISLPTTMLIDQQGNEILRMSGYIDWSKPEVQDFIRRFLSQ